MNNGPKLRMVRLLKNVSPKAIFLSLKMSQSNYSKVERGLINLSDEYLEQAAVILGVAPAFIKNFKEEDLMIREYNYVKTNTDQNESSHISAQMLDMLQTALKTLQSELDAQREHNQHLREQNLFLLQELLKNKQLDITVKE